MLIRPHGQPGVPCIHSWVDGDKHHICRSQASGHPAPCRCACGAEDYCTLNHVATANLTLTAIPHDPRPGPRVHR